MFFKVEGLKSLSVDYILPLLGSVFLSMDSGSLGVYLGPSHVKFVVGWLVQRSCLVFVTV